MPAFSNRRSTARLRLGRNPITGFRKRAVVARPAATNASIASPQQSLHGPSEKNECGSGQFRHEASRFQLPLAGRWAVRIKRAAESDSAARLHFDISAAAALPLPPPEVGGKRAGMFSYA